MGNVRMNEDQCNKQQIDDILNALKTGTQGSYNCGSPNNWKCTTSNQGACFSKDSILGVCNNVKENTCQSWGNFTL